MVGLVVPPTSLLLVSFLLAAGLVAVFKYTRVPVGLWKLCIQRLVVRAVNGLPLLAEQRPNIGFRASGCMCVENVQLRQDPSLLGSLPVMISCFHLHCLRVEWHYATAQLNILLSGLHIEFTQRTCPYRMGRVAEVASPYSERLQVLEELLWKPPASRLPISAKLKAWALRILWAVLVRKVTVDFQNCTLSYRQRGSVGPTTQDAGTDRDAASGTSDSADAREDIVQLSLRTAALHPAAQRTQELLQQTGESDGWSPTISEDLMPSLSDSLDPGGTPEMEKKPPAWIVLKNVFKFLFEASSSSLTGQTALRLAGVNICAMTGTGLKDSAAVQGSLATGGLPSSSDSVEVFVVVRQWSADALMTVGSSSRIAAEAGQQEDTPPAITIISNSRASMQQSGIYPPSVQPENATSSGQEAEGEGSVPAKGAAAVATAQDTGSDLSSLQASIKVSLKSFVPELSPQALAVLLRMSDDYSIYSRCAPHWQVMSAMVCASLHCSYGLLYYCGEIHHTV